MRSTHATKLDKKTRICEKNGLHSTTSFPGKLFHGAVASQMIDSAVKCRTLESYARTHTAKLNNNSLVTHNWELLYLTTSVQGKFFMQKQVPIEMTSQLSKLRQLESYASTIRNCITQTQPTQPAQNVNIKTAYCRNSLMAQQKHCFQGKMHENIVLINF